MSNRAACAGHDPKYWFPVGEPDDEGFETFDYDNEDAEEGRVICLTCPIINLCAERNWGLPHGIIAGKDPKERSRTRKPPKQAKW